VENVNLELRGLVHHLNHRRAKYGQHSDPGCADDLKGTLDLFGGVEGQIFDAGEIAGEGSRSGFDVYY
jgi:hypothetical protein